MDNNQIENTIQNAASNLSFETGLTFEQAVGAFKWFETEGLLDYAILEETYAEPTVRYHLTGVANDA